jgi:flagellar biosynthesis chaperone FliJ
MTNKIDELKTKLKKLNSEYSEIDQKIDELECIKEEITEQIIYLQSLIGQAIIEGS